MIVIKLNFFARAGLKDMVKGVRSVFVFCGCRPVVLRDANDPFTFPGRKISLGFPYFSSAQLLRKVCVANRESLFKIF